MYVTCQACHILFHYLVKIIGYFDLILRDDVYLAEGCPFCSKHPSALVVLDHEHDEDDEDYANGFVMESGDEGGNDDPPLPSPHHL